MSRGRPARRRGHRRRPGPHDQPGLLRAAPRPRPVRRRRRHGRPPGRRGGVAPRHRDARRSPTRSPPPTRSPRRSWWPTTGSATRATPTRTSAGMGTTVVALALVPEEPDPDDADRRRRRPARAPGHRQRGRQPRRTCSATARSSSSPRTTASSPTSCARAASPPRRRRSTRSATSSPGCSGIDETVDVDLWPVDPVAGDRFLLCTDGLFNEVGADQISSVLRRLDDPTEAAAELVRLANEGGGRDNITVVVVDVVDDGGVAQAASAALAGEPSGLESVAPDRSDGDDLAGFTTAMPAVADRGSARRALDVGAHRQAVARRAPRRAEAHTSHPVHVAGRWCSCSLVVAVIGGAVATIQWYGTSTYYVAFEDDEVVIYQGRPGGVLWVEPELVETHRHRPRRRARPLRGRARGRATSTRRWPRPQAYVANIERDIEELDDAAATTTTTPTGLDHLDHRGHDHHRTGPLMLRAVRRNTELGLILLGTLVTVGAYMLASSPRTPPSRPTSAPFLGVVLGLQLAAHIAVRRLAPNADGTLLPIAGLLNGLGYVFIARLDEARPTRRTWPGCRRRGWRSASPPSSPRSSWSGGCATSSATAGRSASSASPAAAPARPGHRARVHRRPHLGEHRPGQLPARRVRQDPAGHLLRVLPGREARAPRREQPPPRADPAPRPEAPRPGAAGLGGVAGRDDQPEGPRQLAAVLRAVRRAALGGHRAGHLPRHRRGCCSPFGAVFAHSQFVHVQDRVDIWLDPWADPKGDGFQIVEAQFAVLGRRRHRHRASTSAARAASRSPRPTSSSPPSARSSACSGASAVLIAFLLIIGAGCASRCAPRCPSSSCWPPGSPCCIGVQAFIIIAGVIRVLPLTGVTLPFVSYGGSSLIANYVLLALLLRISDDTGDPAGGGGRDDPPDPRARDRPDGLLRRAVRAAQPAHRVPGRRAQRQPEQHPGHPPRLQPAPRQHHHGRRRRDRPVGALRATGSSSSASTPRAPLFAHVTGFFSFTLGSSGVEKTYNDELAGRTLELSFQELGDLFVDKDRVGDLTLSVRADLQRVATEQLGDREGSVVALDPRTGEILALVSYPSYDPNLLANHDTAGGRPTSMRLLDANPEKPRLARSYQERFFPGSTFKVVTGTRRHPPRRRHRRRARVPGDRQLHRRRAPSDRSATSADRPAAGRCSRSSGCRATPPSPRWASTPGPSR